MKRSLNEVTNAIKKAAIGAAYPTGIAEDIASAAACLLELGRDGASAAANVLPSQKKAKLSDVAMLGKTPFECVAAGEPSMLLPKVDCPLLLIGLALSSSKDQDCAFRIVFDDDLEGFVGDGFLEIPRSLPTGCDVEIFFVDIEHSRRVSSAVCVPANGGYFVDQLHWARISRWGAETLVPASEQSRRTGAGAGLVDRD